MIAPSGMMDGIIATLRETLDSNGYENLPVMAYSTKFASAYYGPFRDVAQSAPSFGDRKELPNGQRKPLGGDQRELARRGARR